MLRTTITIAVFVAATALGAQAATWPPFSAGDVFIDRNGDTIQIVECRGSGWQNECLIRRIAESGKAPIDPSERWWSLDTLRGSEETWMRNGGAKYSGTPVALPDRVGTTAAAPTPPAGPPQDIAKTVAPPAIAAPSAAGICPRTSYGGPVPGNRPASAALFRQKISDSITMAAYGRYWYGVRLDAFTVGAPVTNSVSVRPGVGATRVTNGAPAGAKLYPVSTTMSVCEGAPNGSSSWRTSPKKYLCFVSANNEWTCGASS